MTGEGALAMEPGTVNADRSAARASNVGLALTASTANRSATSLNGAVPAFTASARDRDSAAVFLSPGVTVSTSGSVYTINHPGVFDFAVVPLVSVSGNATVTSIVSTSTQTVVTLSADAAIAFTVQVIGR